MESFKPFYQMHNYSNKKNNYAQFHCCVIIQNALLSNVDKLYRTHLIVCTIAKYFSVHETILLCRLTTIIFSTILIRPYILNIFTSVPAGQCSCLSPMCQSVLSVWLILLFSHVMLSNIKPKMCNV